MARKQRQKNIRKNQMVNVCLKLTYNVRIAVFFFSLVAAKYGKKSFGWGRRGWYPVLYVREHPPRPRGGQSGREKGRDESIQVRAKEPLGTDSHRTISKNSSGCRLLIGHKKCFVLLCPIGEQFLLSSFREFVHNGYCFDHACLAHAPKKCT